MYIPSFSIESNHLEKKSYPLETFLFLFDHVIKILVQTISGMLPNMPVSRLLVEHRLGEDFGLHTSAVRRVFVLAK